MKFPALASTGLSNQSPGALKMGKEASSALLTLCRHRPLSYWNEHRRRRADSNRRSEFCRLLPCPLATAPHPALPAPCHRV